MVDFSKAFNRQNHNILITKLSDMGVPGWLIKIVISFLENRKMYVKYKGKLSNVKSLLGGGPQGTLLALGTTSKKKTVKLVTSCKIQITPSLLALIMTNERMTNHNNQ